MVHRLLTDAHLYEPPVRYKIRTPETWEKARADYCAGMPAPAVCARYDIGLSALRQRARAEGWRRVDCDDPEPLDPDAPPPDPVKMADEAWARVGQAVERGRVLEAQRWMKLARELRVAAREAEAAQRERLRREEEAARRAAGEEDEPAGGCTLDDPDDLDAAAERAPTLHAALALPADALTTEALRDAADWARFWRREVRYGLTWEEAEDGFQIETEGWRPPAPDASAETPEPAADPEPAPPEA